MEKIRQYTEEEVLYSFYNNHLNEYMSAKINVELAKVKVAEDPEKVIGYKTHPPLAKGMPPSTVELRAKDYLKEFQQKATQQKELLDTIKNLLKSKNYEL